MASSVLDQVREELLTGQRIGSYEVCEPIAEGGMGTVYRGVRIHDFQKQVAIKVIKRGMDTSFVLRRFLYERQILAGLDHPHIARLLDAGATEDGRPYLVMEYIEGKPITDYADERGAGIPERLELFRTVCSAAHYAHQNLVVHRDLKPGNILVTAGGTLKLLDFGIAKLLEPGADATMTSLRLLTPECASPEQVRGDPVTTATDIYSLGVLLYQLLTGEPPHHFSTRSAEEIKRIVCDSEPRLPSRVRPLPDDLDNIVLKAMHKDPARRYASAEELSEDIRRFLAGLPVIARKDTLPYRASKFVRRHKAGTAAAVLVALSLFGGMGAVVREAHIARLERARAERRFNDVRKLANSLIFEIHDSIQNLSGATPARKLLLERAVQYLDSLAKESGGDSSLQRELATAYQRIALLQGSAYASNVGDTEAALHSFRKAISNWQAVAKANPNNVIDQLEVAYGHRALAVMDSSMGRPGAREELDRAMAISALLLAGHLAVPQVLNERSIEYEVLSGSQQESGDFASALASLREDLALKERVRKLDPQYHNMTGSMAIVKAKMGDLMAWLGSRREALEVNAAGLELYQSLADKDATDARVRRELAVTLGKRGDILLMDGLPASALDAFREALSILQPMADADAQNALFRQDVAGAWSAIGRALVMHAKYSGGLAMLDRAIRAYEQSANADPSLNEIAFALGTSLVWHGEALLGAGRPGAALESFERAASSFTPLANSSNQAGVALAVTYSKSAGVLARLGRNQDAFAKYERALAIVEPLNSPANVSGGFCLADVYCGLGDLSRGQARRPGATVGEQRQRWADARKRYQESMDAARKLPNPGAVSPQGFLYHQAGAPAILACDIALRRLDQLEH